MTICIIIHKHMHMYILTYDDSRSALFKGQIEKRMPLVPKFLGSLDHSISVAINTYGVHIIKGVTPPVRS